jgi:hypothetical protein
LCDATLFTLLRQRMNLTYRITTVFVVSFLYFASRICICWMGFHSNNVGFFVQVIFVSHSYQTWFFGFIRLVFLTCGFLTTWSRGLHHFKFVFNFILDWNVIFPLILSWFHIWSLSNWFQGFFNSFCKMLIDFKDSDLMIPH